MLNSLAAIYSTVGGAATDFESIATVTVGAGGATSISFSSIPSTYKHLQLRCYAVVGSGTNFNMRYNSDTGANYAYHQIYGTGATVGTGNSASITNIPFMYQGGVGATIVDILDYSSSNKNKTSRSLDGYDANGSGSIAFWSGLWMSTSAINSLTIQGGTFNQNSVFALYGIKG